MESSSRLCYLKNLDNKLPNIDLPHKVPVVIGRDRSTLIDDVLVSRKQITAIADITTQQIVIKPIGSAYSGCNGYALEKYSAYKLFHGDLLEIRLGHHKYEVIFDPPPEVTRNSDSQVPAKISRSDANTYHGTWECVVNNQLLIYTPVDINHSSTIAAFDMDGTLIKTKSGNRFPKDYYDWELNGNNVIKKLKELHSKKFKIVIFTNQAGIGRKQVKLGDFKRKIESILKLIDVPIQVFISPGEGMYRKPMPGMWNALCDYQNNKVSINMEKSFYVGDAAGRPKNWAPKKNRDHSSADRFFAANVGLKFFTPEEFFSGGPKPVYPELKFDPKNVVIPSFTFSPPDELEVIVMVGGPASGKSFFCKTYLIPNGYAHINRDKLGSWQRCVQSLTDCLQRKQKVVIDNTNPDPESRKRYTAVVRQQKVKCRCFVMTTPHLQMLHNNKFRELTDKTHTKVGEMVINSFRKNYQPPALNEGFSDIVNVPFIPKFENRQKEELYKMFLLADY